MGLTIPYFEEFYIQKVKRLEVIKQIEDRKITEEDIKKVEKEIIDYFNKLHLNKLSTRQEIIEAIEREENGEAIEDREIKDLKLAFLDALKDRNTPKATELIVDYILKRKKIYTTKDDLKTEMWVYEMGIYVPQGKSEVRKIMRKILGEYFNAYYYNLVINKLEPDTFIDSDVFFGQNYVDEIAVKNGILNLDTRELGPFNPSKIFFSKINAEYDPEARCPLIDKFLRGVLSEEEDRKVIYELGGFCLWKEYTYEKAFMFVGNGRNGKDKTLELLKRLVGVDNCCSVPLSSIVPESFIVSEFFQKMINLSGEINNKDLRDPSMFKALTGRSLLSAQRKFLRPVTFVNYAKFVFACNELPMVYDNSRGFWDRWVLLEFPFTFVSEEELEKAEDKSKLKLRDEDIIDKITSEKEMSGLLNAFLDGLDRLRDNRDFSTTKGSDEVKNTWIRKSNSVMAFAMSQLEGDYESVILKREFRKKYIDYCKEHKVLPRSDTVIKRTLEDLFGVSEGRKENLGKFERIWEGIKWKR